MKSIKTVVLLTLALLLLLGLVFLRGFKEDGTLIGSKKGSRGKYVAQSPELERYLALCF